MISVRPAGIRVGGRVRGCRVTSFVRGSRFRRRMARQRQAVVVIFNSFFPPCVFLLLIHFADGKLGAVLWRWMKNQAGLGYSSSVLWLKQMFTYASFLSSSSFRPWIYLAYLFLHLFITLCSTSIAFRCSYIQRTLSPQEIKFPHRSWPSPPLVNRPATFSPCLMCR